MGAACCIVAPAKSRTIMDGPPSETLQRLARYSPSWSFRCDNRGRVAGEELSAHWLQDGGGGNNSVDTKSGTPVETEFSSEEGSPIDNFRASAWQKSSASEVISENSMFPSSDRSISPNLGEVKELIGFKFVSCTSPVKLSSSAPSIPSLSTSPLSSQIHLLPSGLTPYRLQRRSPGRRLLRQVSDSRIPEYKSPTFSISEEPSSFLPVAWGNDSVRGSNGGSSDGWSIPASSDFMTNRKERWSFDSEISGFSRNKITRSIGHSRSSSDLHTCGVCMKLLGERSSLRWSSHTSFNELAVVSVLTCGHAYHAECLENMTSEINKYDPDCPICTFGEKCVLKMSGKALKAEMDSKAKKRSRNRVVDGDINRKYVFDNHKSDNGVEGGGPLRNSSVIMKSLGGKPFLRRHFSFAFKTCRSFSENHSSRRKVFSWGKA